MEGIVVVYYWDRGLPSDMVFLIVGRKIKQGLKGIHNITLRWIHEQLDHFEGITENMESHVHEEF